MSITSCSRASGNEEPNQSNLGETSYKSTEGVYQWITVNSKLQRFAQKETKTLGVIKMDRFSIQIDYELESQTPGLILDRLKYSSKAQSAFLDSISYLDEKSITGSVSHPYKLFSVTFPGLGSDSARDAYVDLLIHNKLKRKRWFNQFFRKQEPDLDPVNGIVLQNPCLPTGSFEMLKRPKKMLDAASRGRQTVGFNIKDGDETFTATIIGGSNDVKCRMQLASLLSLAKEERLNCEKAGSCSMSLLVENFIPYDQEKFVGLGAFVDITNEMGLKYNYNHKDMIKAISKICRKNYDELVTEFSDLNKRSPFKARNLCFYATWIEVVLEHGLKMPSAYENFIMYW